MIRSSYRKGNVTITDPEGPAREFDSFVCCHCNQIIIVEYDAAAGNHSVSTLKWDGDDPNPARAQARHKKRRGFCMMCMGPTCGSKACAKCIPFEAKMEAQEGKRRFWRQMDLLGR